MNLMIVFPPPDVSMADRDCDGSRHEVRYLEHTIESVTWLKDVELTEDLDVLNLLSTSRSFRVELLNQIRDICHLISFRGFGRLSTTSRQEEGVLGQSPW